MKKYYNQSRNFPQNIFTRYRMIKSNINHLQKDINDLKKQISFNHSNNSLNDAKDALLDKYELLQKNNKKLADIRKRIAIIASAIGLSVSIVTPIGINSIINHNENTYFNTIEEGYSVVDENALDSSSSSYIEFKEFLSDYIELSNKSQLSSTEEKKLDWLKSEIQSSPEEITKFSLEILKTKIANSLHIDDFNRITIHDDSTQVKADAYNYSSGKITDISICLDGQPIFRNHSFTDLDGHKVVHKNSIPQEVLSAINAIVNAQKDDLNKKQSYIALKTSLNLDVSGISLQNNENAIEEEEK